MSKLDWSKASRSGYDPARVVDGGDYGVLPDKLADRKSGYIKPKKSKPIKQSIQDPRIRAFPTAVDGRSASSQAADTAHNQVLAKISAAKKQGRRNLKIGKLTIRNQKNRGSGLTISELVTRAKKKVESLEKDIFSTERKLMELRNSLLNAKIKFVESQSLRPSPKLDAVV